MTRLMAPVVLALAALDAPEIEAQRDQPGRAERPRRPDHERVAQAAGVQRMRMADHGRPSNEPVGLLDKSLESAYRTEDVNFLAHDESSGRVP